MRLNLIMPTMMSAANACYLNLGTLSASLHFLCLLLKEKSKCLRSTFWRDGARRLSGDIHR